MHASKKLEVLSQGILILSVDGNLDETTCARGSEYLPERMV